MPLPPASIRLGWAPVCFGTHPPTHHSASVAICCLPLDSLLLLPALPRIARNYISQPADVS